MTDDIKTSISVAILLALTGCAPAYDWSGDWEGHVGSGPVKNPIEGTARRVQLSVAVGKPTVLTWMGFPATGDLQTSGRNASFIGKTVMGQPLDRQGPAVASALSSVDVHAVSETEIEVTLKGADGPVVVKLTRQLKPDYSR